MNVCRIIIIIVIFGSSTAAMANRFHDGQRYGGFSWHTHDAVFRARARQALAEAKGSRQTAIKWDDEAQRETDDGGYLVWKTPATINAAHSWFTRVFKNL